MANYDWSDYDEGPLSARFPEDARGYEQWLSLSPILGQVAEPQAPLPSFGLDILPRRELAVPRVFISHRQADTAKALQAARLAGKCGFEVWLDVLDPTLGSASNPLAIALLIEMALLNSSHLLAVLTQNTPGTMWVPYEYGRVKEGRPITQQVGAWVNTLAPVPEYLHLGVIASSRNQVQAWLQREQRRWKKWRKTP